MQLSPRSVWFAPERDNGSGGPGEAEGNGKRNGEPAPSTLLVIEDEVLPRMAITDFLRDCGYRVLEAANGEEAQAILRSGELVELMFSDINLGAGINGIELAEWTRKNYPGVHILLTSGKSDMADMADALCDRPLVTKPYSYPALVDEISQVLGALGGKRG